MFNTIRTISLAAMLIGCNGQTPDLVGEYIPGPNLGKGDVVSLSKDLPSGAMWELGEIPRGATEVEVQLRATTDMDIQLVDPVSGEKIVHWDGGVLSGPYLKTAPYGSSEITWSGYLGDGSGAGNETLKIQGITESDLALRIYSYEGGAARVDMTWETSEPGDPPAVLSLERRINEFAEAFSPVVTLATKQGRPVIFIDTHSMRDDPEKAAAVYGELYKVIGANHLMVWNPPGEDNYFHMATGEGGADDPLSPRFRNMGIRIYSHFHIWDISGGNLDWQCWYEGPEEDPDDLVYRVTGQCHNGEQIERQRTMALIKVTDQQLGSLNDYLQAISDDFMGTLGPANFGGGLPPYFGGSQHNCTSWFTHWITREVSSQFPTSVNPASFMLDITGSYGAPTEEVEALVIFNHPQRPISGTELEPGFPFEFGT